MRMSDVNSIQQCTAVHNKCHWARKCNKRDHEDWKETTGIFILRAVMRVCIENPKGPTDKILNLIS